MSSSWLDRREYARRRAARLTPRLHSARSAVAVTLKRAAGLSVCLIVCLSVSFFACLIVCLCACLSVCLFVCLFV